MSQPMYSVVVPNSPEVPGEGKPRRSVLCPDKLLENYPSIKPGTTVTTLYENFLEGVHRAAGGDFIGHRPVVNGAPQEYQWQTYNHVRDRVTHFGAGLSHIGLGPKGLFGVMALNRPEWTMSELAGYQYSYIGVALYDSLGVSAIEFIVNQTEMEVIIASADKALILLHMKSSLASLKTLIVMGDAEESLVNEGKELGVKVVTWTEVERLGRETPIEASHPTPEDIATICYTSGTTGTPKGAILTHKNFVATIASFQMLAKHGKFFIPTNADVHISYLPLAHVFERLCQSTMISGSARIGYYQGDTLKLLDDIAILKPTIFVSVPRLFNRIYDKVLAGVKAKGGIAAFLFNRAYAAKRSNLKKGSIEHPLWDKLVFGDIRARLGGRVKHIVSGSAPISPDVMDFLRICFSADVYEGYGQTEQAAGLSISYRGDLTPGQVGPPQLCTEVKLKDIPSMNYTSADKPFPRGEVMLRGNSVFTGYYKSPKQTEETLDAEGWSGTGDVGQWDAQGRLIIIDRVKNIFKLAQGEYIAPEKIEAVLAKHYLIAQVFVYGHSLQATLVGIVIPDAETLKVWSNENNLGDKTYEELCAHPQVKTTILKELATFGRESDLKGFEILKNIHVTSEQFSIENDLLTPTFKLKRHAAKDKYDAEIERMYKELE
ncbi:Long chain acyl-CoA synthetase 7 peroxisomal [Lunasporangiospora selenospora]|uniref:Long-chain-fatty-acid--CoA ligase n=1 Tax=Lunasporangiospora selenospora TaxID=979761 RepID=A0A9P6KBT7_9FUNG|nr:Long chain acyl-CoA synthetase 7 peroxisomal [Lunasporangiospora selenospora]